MKLELNREDMEQAVNCFIGKQGVDLSSQEIKYVFSRKTVKVELTPIANMKKMAKEPEPEQVMNATGDKIPAVIEYKIIEVTDI